MRSEDEHLNSLDSSLYKELRLLEEVDRASDLSQRQLAHRLGIALGVANILVRSLAKQGYIRMTRLSWKRWVYVLTPAGMSRKLNLTFAYIERFVNHYKKVRFLLRQDLARLSLSKDSKVAILGTSEYAELAYLALKDLGVNDIEIFDLRSTDRDFLGIKVSQMSEIHPERYCKIVIALPKERGLLRENLMMSGIPDSQIVEMFGWTSPQRLGVSGDSNTVIELGKYD